MSKVGRPTKYKEEYCDMLIKHMSEGYSFESFAGVVGVSKQTIYDWLDANSQFLDAKQIAIEKCRLWWERAGMRGMMNDEKDLKFNAQVYNLNMKNRFNWSDRVKQEHSGELTLEQLVSKSMEESDE